jgi:hypothetical protein
MSRSRTAPVAALGAVLICSVLAGCAGGGEDDRADRRSPGTTVPSGPTTSTTLPSPDPGAGPLCAVRAEWQAKADALDPRRVRTPAGRREAFELALGALRAAAEVATPRIRPHIERVVSGYERARPILARHRWDPSAVPSRERKALDRLDLGIATEQLNAYVRVNCGPGRGPSNVVG